jgi:3'-phosphoadenosine 5'-phosphosulfate sulfotransferase (PAPS reductase)/FAD synthetase
MLIMRDDDRMKLKPGEVVENRLVRFRTLGCYPLTGAIDSEADTLRHCRRNADRAHLRTAGPSDRP